MTGTLKLKPCYNAPSGQGARNKELIMKQRYYRHPSGVTLAVEFTDRTPTEKPTVRDVRVTEHDTGEPVGPNLAQMLHDTFTLNTSTDPAVATRILDHMMQEVENA